MGAADRCAWISGASPGSLHALTPRREASQSPSLAASCHELASSFRDSSVPARSGYGGGGAPYIRTYISRFRLHGLDLPHVDLGSTYFDERDHTATERRLVHRLEQLGLLGNTSAQVGATRVECVA